LEICEAVDSLSSLAELLEKMEMVFDSLFEESKVKDNLNSLHKDRKIDIIVKEAIGLLSKNDIEM
jgi:hypothetical protein